MEPSRDLTATLGVSAVSGSLRLALQSRRLGLLVIDLVAFRVVLGLSNLDRESKCI